MRTFTLKIKGGNAAMQTRADIAKALRREADRLVNGDFNPDTEVSIADINGNTVGHWKIT